MAISDINENFPVEGIDQSSQGFRDNFLHIKTELTALASVTSDTISDSVFTAFDFTNTPDGTLPATDLTGKALTLVEAPASSNAVPIIENGAARTTGINVGSATAFYMGLETTTTIYEMGSTVILGDGVMAMLITQGGLFDNPNWAMHLKVTSLTVSLELYVNNAAVILSTAGINISKTEQTRIVAKFVNNTCYIFVNGAYVCQGTDTRISSFPRLRAVFEPFQNNGNVAYTRLISGYCKNTKQTGNEIVGLPTGVPTIVDQDIPVAITLTTATQTTGLQLGTNISCPGINTALVIVKLRLNQTSVGDILLNAQGINVATGVITNNEVVASKAVKDDIITIPINVQGLRGGILRLRMRGAFGTVPATTAETKMSVTIIPTSLST